MKGATNAIKKGKISAITVLLAFAVNACFPVLAMGATNAKPTVEITSPSSGTKVTRGESVEIEAYAEDDVGVQGMALYIDGDKVETFYSDSFSYNLSTDDLNAGSHRIDVNAFDGEKKGTDYVSFKVIEPIVEKPSVTTKPASEIGQTSACLNGSVDKSNGADITEYGFKYGTSSSNLDQKVAAGYDNISGSFSYEIDGLQPGT